MTENVAPEKCPTCAEAGPFDVLSHGQGFRCLACGESFPAKQRSALIFRPARLRVPPLEAPPLPERGQPIYLPIVLPTGSTVGMPWVSRVVGFTAYDRPEGKPGRERTIDPREWVIESFQIGSFDQFLGELPLALICDPLDPGMMVKTSTIYPGAEIRVRARRILGPALPAPRKGTELESTRELAAENGYVPEGRCLWLVVA